MTQFADLLAPPDLVWPYHPELLATPVPRYTSYPTAAEFRPSVGPTEHERALAQVAGEVTLYVHIPFCERICWYCGCNTGAANRAQRLEGYIGALHREIELVSARLPAGAHVGRVAFGGGSPNALPPATFLRLFDALERAFNLAGPIVSVELDPRSLSLEWEGALRAVGTSHASFGVQTFSPRLQQAIGRVQPLELIDRGVELLRAAGITSLNFDLMYGLPGQTRADLAETLEVTEAFAPERIALFGYAHVPHMLPRQRQIDAARLPDQAERFAMASDGFAYLTEAGYVPVGFDHFALPGDPLARAATAGHLRRNFQGFTDDGAPTLIALGASAISGFPELLVQNDKNAGRYRAFLAQGLLPAAGGVVRTANDRQRGRVIEQLLCQGHARLEPGLLAETYPALQPFIAAGLCTLENDILTIARRALPYARSLAARFDAYRQLAPGKFSSAI